MKNIISTFLIILFAQTLNAQQSDFWSKVQFGGGLGLNFGNGVTDVSISPSAIYNANKYLAYGIGLKAGYAAEENLYKSTQFGGSLIGLVNLIEEIQLSLELETTRVSTTFNPIFTLPKAINWYTGLYVGAGYRIGQNVTIGLKYDILFDKTKNNGTALLPFVRVYF
jgi:long-subunit fatty acid transport protein